jgi:hypothetical protein
MRLEMHAFPGALLAFPLLFVLHVPSGTLAVIVPGAASFDYQR